MTEGLTDEQITDLLGLSPMCALSRARAIDDSAWLATIERLQKELAKWRFEGYAEAVRRTSPTTRDSELQARAVELHKEAKP